MLEAMNIHDSIPVPGRPYAWVTASARYAVDPEEAVPGRITDLASAPREADGRVRFEGRFAMLCPYGGGSGRAVVAIPNRGLARMPLASGSVPLREQAALADAWLLDEGWTVAFPGWQWDLPEGLLGLDPPIVNVEPGWLRTELRVETPIDEWMLGDMVSLGADAGLARCRAYPAASLDDADATLHVRSVQRGAGSLVPRADWSFTSPLSIALRGGFEPHHWYELAYRSEYAPVVGAGLLAIRAAGSWLRRTHSAVFAHGVSQCGRLLREFLWHGQNLDGAGERVFDGMMIELAGARRGEFNRRFGQPGLYSPIMVEDGPPYDTASLLAAQREIGGLPKVFFVNSAAEY